MRYSPLLLCGLGLIAFLPVLRFPPSLADDVLMFSSVARAASPLSFFFSDWGIGGNMYRPLVSLSYWLIYHTAGASSPLSQGLSLFCHLAVALTTYRLLKKIDCDSITAALFSALIVLSMFTAIPVTLAPDRGSLYIGLWMLLLLLHKVRCDQKNVSLNPVVVGALCALALMSKESGVVVVGLAFFMAFHRPGNRPVQISVIAVVLVLVAVYGALRVVLFGGHAAQYGSAAFNPVETIKNFWTSLSAPFLPIYGRDPGLIGFLKRLVPVVPTVILWAAVVRRRPTALQIWCLLIVLMNAAVHAYEFRYRFIYLAHIAFCIFVASSPILKQAGARRKLVHAAGLLLLIYNMYWAAGHVRSERHCRDIVITENLATLVPYEQKGLIDDSVKAEVLEIGRK